jgi:hypothetical protein
MAKHWMLEISPNEHLLVRIILGSIVCPWLLCLQAVSIFSDTLDDWDSQSLTSVLRRALIE